MNTIITAVEEFLRHCKFDKNLNFKTIKHYRIDLMQLISFLTENNYSLEITNVSKNELRKFIEDISTLKPKSIKRKVATIKAMFNYLEYEDIIISNPFRKMRIQIKEPKKLPQVMNLEEITEIFKQVYKQFQAVKITNSYSYFETLRNLVLVELLFATGARVSEIAYLKKENINILTGTVIIMGKGSRERFIQICNDETLKILKDYYEVFYSKINSSGGYFLINRQGGKLSDQSIRTIVKNLAKNACIQKHITPHVFRHTFATLLLEKDVDIKYIQSLLGHSSIMTTQIYTQVNHEKQKQILNTKHPRKDFSFFHFPPGE